MKLLFYCFFFLISFHLSSQVTLTVRVNSGSSGTSCTDGTFGGTPELHWRVQVAGQGYTTYPRAGICFTDPPNTQYTEVFNCAFPDSLTICFRAFEDDGASCVVSMSCLEEVCQNFATPTPGNSLTYNLTIPNDGSNLSWGTVNFTITTTGSLPPGGAYDQLCNAIDLGTINSGGTLGDKTLSNYANFCASNAGDPNPWGGNNDQGVWFQFTTGSAIGSSTLIEATNDPQSLGDAINLQLALYESNNNLCSGTLTLVMEDYDGVFFDESMNVSCLKPNTTYFLLVDGEGVMPTPSQGVEGYFGLEITDNGITQAADLICDAQDLGLVPNGGSVSTGTLNQSNNCATNTSDPTPSTWTPDQTVWFQFQAPLTGSVVVSAVSDLPFPSGTDAIDLELAVYSSNDNTCTGTLTELASGYTSGVFDETLTVRCLIPGENYWVLVDGSSLNVDGIFDLTIADEGGNSISTGTDMQTACDAYLWTDGNTYTANNTTALDTFVNVLGCDSIVTLNLTIVNSDTVYAGADTSICVGVTSANLLGNVPMSGSGMWTSLGSATVDFPTQNNSSVSGLINGNNEFVWAITNSPCPTIRDTVNIVVEDTILPLISCPANQNVYFDNNCDLVLTDYTALALTSDNCSSSITVSQNPMPGTIITATQVVILIADDGNGNKDSCQFSVIPTDTILPSIICPGNQNVFYDGNCQYTLSDYTGLATANDNCGSPSITQNPLPGTLLSSNQTVVLTVSDSSGNKDSCMFDVILSDTTSPVITCPGNQNVFYNGNCEYTLLDYTGVAVSSDNCGSVTVIQNPAAGTILDTNQMITLIAVDGAGNIDSCTFEIIPLDTITPTINCPSNQNVFYDGSCQFTLLDYTTIAVASDNCGIVSIIQTPAAGTSITSPQSVVLTVTDGSGNKDSCQFSVIPSDTTSPMITCPSNQNVFYDGNCQYTLLDYTGLATTNDNCDSLSITQTPLPGTILSSTQTVVLTVTDSSGNKDSCLFDVIPSDTISPAISCPGDQIVYYGTSCDYVLADYTGLAVTNDNCSSAITVTQIPIAGTLLSLTQTVILTADDGNGNTSQSGES